MGAAGTRGRSKWRISQKCQDSGLSQREIASRSPDNNLSPGWQVNHKLNRSDRSCGKQWKYLAVGDLPPWLQWLSNIFRGFPPERLIITWKFSGIVDSQNWQAQSQQKKVSTRFGERIKNPLIQSHRYPQVGDDKSSMVWINLYWCTRNQAIYAITCR